MSRPCCRRVVTTVSRRLRQRAEVLTVLTQGIVSPRSQPSSVTRWHVCSKSNRIGWQHGFKVAPVAHHHAGKALAPQLFGRRRRTAQALEEHRQQRSHHHPQPTALAFGIAAIRIAGRGAPTPISSTSAMGCCCAA